MRVVLDVSAALSVILESTLSGRFSSYLESSDEVLAPDLFIAEAASTAWKFNYLKNASREECELLAQRSIQLVDFLIFGEELWPAALALACETGHSVYDCFYLVLAKQGSATLLTMDKKLITLAQQLKIKTAEL